MSHSWYIRLLLYIVLALSDSYASALKPSTLPGAQVGYIIIDLYNGNTVTSCMESTAFIPASTLKCVTAAASLSKLGCGFSFETQIRYSGHIAADTLHGNLMIIGSGDPSADYSLATSIHENGINHIDGFIDIIASEPSVNPAAMIEDIGTDYGAGWSEFNYCANRALVNEDMELFPFAYIADDFTADLRNAGISIDNSITEPADTGILFIHTSKPLSSMLRHMLFESDNLYAEAIGRSLSADLSLPSALDSVNTFLHSIGIEPDRTRLVDFSGLSRTNLITPRDLAHVLANMAHDINYVSAYPIAGKEGHMALKSGSMTGVLAYAGYRLDRTGKPSHAIVIMINNALCSQSEMKRYISQWLLKNF